MTMTTIRHQKLAIYHYKIKLGSSLFQAGHYSS